jgi:dolichyl-phosphate-mannose--protein O-mannosyl transferase
MNIIEAIIELLIANIFFVILIAGGIYSFFKRMNESKNTNRPVQTKRASKQPKQTISPFGVPAETGNLSDTKSIITTEMQDQRTETINRRYENMKQKNASHRYQDKEEAIMGSFKADQKELQKAVIWSEILAKPKALQRLHEK